MNRTLHPRSYYLLCLQAALAADKMRATTDLQWHEMADRLRELAGQARTGRALTRLVKMAVYSEIQADLGVNIDQVEADKAWAAYCRRGA